MVVKSGQILLILKVNNFLTMGMGCEKKEQNPWPKQLLEDYAHEPR